MKRFPAMAVPMLAFCTMLPNVAAAQASGPCGAEMLKGRYVFTATDSTRPPASGPGTPWTPKAILEILVFNGDGTLTTPAVTVANPFGDTGGILAPPAGAPGAYIVNADCTGRIHFFDANGAMFNIFVETPHGDTIQMIQVNPSTTSSRDLPGACPDANGGGAN